MLLKAFITDQEILIMNKNLACAVLAASFIFTGTAESASFPAAGIDNTTSLGKFSIDVVGSFIGIVSNMSLQLSSDGFTWNSNTDVLTSPLLYDPSTQIYHGTPYASANNGPIDTVNTKIVSFDMSGAGGTSILAGSKAIDAPASIGQVTSLPSNNPAGGFPAKSFFDIFVNVTLPGLSDGFLYNRSNSPLLISNPSISSFPPNVVYIHGNSSAVPIYLHDPQINASNDVLFGYLTLAGHGVGYTNSTADVDKFNQAFSGLTSAPLPSTPADPTVAPLPIPGAIFFVAPALAGVFGWSRRKNRAGLA